MCFVSCFLRDHLRSLRRRFPDCSVVVFGSSLSELATPHSDIDLSLVLPAIQQRTEALEEQMRAATAEYTRLCAEVGPCNEGRLGTESPGQGRAGQASN